MPREDSPSDFIVFRTPAMRDDRLDPARLYAQALDLVEKVHIVVEHTAARFHLRDRLDRAVTMVAVRFARAESELKSNRWRYYRDALGVITDVVTMLDIIDRQKITTEDEALTEARALARRLLTDVRPLAALG
jgi:uncharacterized protein RhaS with RHS repeats